MKIIFHLRLMLLAISKERGRMILVIFMVALGLAASMVLVALGNGARLEIQIALAKSGQNLLVVAPATMQSIPGRGGGWYAAQSLKTQDTVDVLANVDGVTSAVSIIEQSQLIKFADNNIRTMVKGVSPEFTVLRHFELSSGRFITEQDNAQKSKVALLGSFVAKKLSPDMSLLNERVIINGTLFTVVGELAEKGKSNAGTNYDDLVVVPYATAKSRLFNKNRLDRILMQHDGVADSTMVVQDISEIIRDNHHIEQGDKDDFKILSEGSPDMAKDTSDDLLGGLAVFFTAITLFAAGIGVLSVSYLNVLDRKAEIGLRMALGATQQGIALMIIAEAGILCALGGLSGTILGMCTIAIFKLMTNWQLAVSFEVIVVPFVVAVLLGMLFSVFPARTAARLLPVEALKAD